MKRFRATKPLTNLSFDSEKKNISRGAASPLMPRHKQSTERVMWYGKPGEEQRRRTRPGRWCGGYVLTGAYRLRSRSCACLLCRSWTAG